MNFYRLSKLLLEGILGKICDGFPQGDAGCRGGLRRESLDHAIVFKEAYLRVWVR